MESPELDSMLELQRVPRDPLSLLLLLLYSPIGVCLFLLRLFIGAHVFLVSCGLPDCMVKRCVIRVMSSILGVCITQSEPRVQDHSVKIYISNHRTYFDHNVISLLTPCSSPSVSCPPGFLCWARGFLELGAPGSRSRLLESLKHYLSQPGSPPLLLYPEEETTNGKTGLLQFSSWPFSLSDTFQPLTLCVQRPLISPAVSGCHWVVELFWMFFVPYTVYQDYVSWLAVLPLRALGTVDLICIQLSSWLPPVSRNLRESDEEFASRVQQLVALPLGLACTSHTAADRAEHLKRRSHEAPRPTTRDSPLTSADQHMAERVKEVLPHVPLLVIHRDLARTGCVDTTITNLLEGRVPYEDETAGGSNVAAGPPPSQSTRASRSFGRRPEDRHLSLQERKEALYDYARRRYLEKYGVHSLKEHAARG